MIKKNLAKFIHILHKFLVYFTVFGFLLPKRYLKYHLIAWPIIFLHWQTNNEKCCLSELENWLLGKKTMTVDKDHFDGDSNFTTAMFNDIGIHLTQKQIHFITLFLFSCAWIISAKRFYL
jgi:hypothetical protein